MLFTTFKKDKAKQFDVYDEFELTDEYIPDIISKEQKLELIYKKLKEKAEKMNIPIDGIVITFNDVEFSKNLGRTSHHYNDSLAYKF